MRTTPTVKSDPYKKGIRTKRQDNHLWTEENWRLICARAAQDCSPEVAKLIAGQRPGGRGRG